MLFIKKTKNKLGPPVNTQALCLWATTTKHFNKINIMDQNVIHFPTEFKHQIYCLASLERCQNNTQWGHITPKELDEVWTQCQVILWVLTKCLWPCKADLWCFPLVLTRLHSGGCWCSGVAWGLGHESPNEDICHLCGGTKIFIPQLISWYHLAWLPVGAVQISSFNINAERWGDWQFPCVAPHVACLDNKVEPRTY